MKLFRHSISAVAAMAVLSLASPLAGSSQVSVKVELDSAHLLMGRTTPLRVEVVGNLSETGGILLPDTLWREVEIASVSEPLVTDLGNGRKELRQEITLQAFDSGLYTLPPVLYVQDGQVSESNRPALKVIPAEVDSMVTVHDYYGAQNPPRYFFDFLPEWMTDYGVWILLVILIAGAATYIYMKWLRHGRIPLIPAKKPVPPYELAMQQLATLKAENLCERGEEKEYYTRLTDILRSYLDTRFNINAMEMTSTQILHALQSNEETRVPRKYMSKILETADFVKFAKVRPLPDDNVAAFRSAMQFVEDTKPQEIPAEESGKTVTSQTNMEPDSLKSSN